MKMLPIVVMLGLFAYALPVVADSDTKKFTHHVTLHKLKKRDPKRHHEFASVKFPVPHPLFKIIPGEVREWEKTR